MLNEDERERRTDDEGVVVLWVVMGWIGESSVMVSLGSSGMIGLRGNEGRLGLWGRGVEI